MSHSDQIFQRLAKARHDVVGLHMNVVILVILHTEYQHILQHIMTHIQILQ